MLCAIVQCTIVTCTVSVLNVLTHYIEPRLLPRPQEYTRAKQSLSPDSLAVMHETSVRSVEDMSALGDLHEAAILHNIHQRYRANKIYVSCGGGVGRGGGEVEQGVIG